MCSDLIHIDGQQFACRKCNECITARKNGWVARAMAEKAVTAETFSVTLTYNDATQESRDAAKTFEYRHVKNWIKNLRRQIEYTTGQTGLLRYLVAGERGSDKGRCHWHVILFCNADILTLGKMTHWPSGKLAADRAEIITTGKRKKRINWSLWPYGFVSFQEPDQWGMEYALAYALKDQFNIVSAAGTAREAHVSRTSAGMFRMSKKPPIGFPFLERKLNALDARGQLPVDLKIRVPDYKGYWYPTGAIREYMLDRLRISNELYKAQHGRNAPQWTSLTRSVEQNEKDWERLIHGTEAQEEEQVEDFEEWQRSILLRTKEIRQQQIDRDTRKRCGGLSACSRCLNSLTPQDFDAAARWAERQARKHGGYDAAEKHYRSENRCNPYCGYRELPTQKRAFKKGA